MTKLQVRFRVDQEAYFRNLTDVAVPGFSGALRATVTRSSNFSFDNKCSTELIVRFM